MLRTLLTALVVPLWTLILLVPVFFSVLLTFSGNAGAWMARRLWAPVVLWVAGIDLVAEPNSAVDPRHPYVFVSNHQGFFDIPATYATVENRLRFVAKRSLGWVPILGWFLHLNGHILIDRSNRERSLRSLRMAARQVAAGKSILVYPEGTRSPDGTIGTFKKGPFVMALQAQVPLVPVAVNGSHHILPKHGWRLKPGQLRIKVGDPIPTAGCSLAERDRLMQQVRERLVALHLEIGGAGDGSTEPAPVLSSPQWPVTGSKA